MAQVYLNCKKDAPTQTTTTMIDASTNTEIPFELLDIEEPRNFLKTPTLINDKYVKEKINVKIIKPESENDWEFVD